MRNKLPLLNALGLPVIASLLASACSTSPVPDGPDVALVARESPSIERLLERARFASLEGQVLAEINRFREEHGRRPMVRHGGLDALAECHSLAMGECGTMSHRGFDRRASEAEERFGLTWAAENVLRATGYADTTLADLVVKTWSESRDHRKNLLRSNVYTGVGIFRGEGGVVWVTQLSARPH